MDMSLSKLREMVKGREAWHAVVWAELGRVRHDLVTEQQFLPGLGINWHMKDIIFFLIIHVGSFLWKKKKNALRNFQFWPA